MTLTDIPTAARARAILPEHAGYDAARQAWNLSVDQRPAAVVAAESVAEVAAAIRLAATDGRRLVVQGTGHGAAPLGSLRGALLLRTEGLAGVEIDPVARRARVGAGTIWRDVVAAAATHGLATTAGSAPSVGVVGYTLGGGLSLLSRSLGLACNSVTAVEIVTADGRPRRVDAGEDPELFWALRGGGGGFGVVTAIEFGLHELTEVHAGSLMYPIERAGEVLAAWGALTRGPLPDELATVARLLKFPPISEIPEPIRGQSFVAVEAFHAGEPHVADELLAGLRALRPAIDTIGPIAASEISTVHNDPDQPTPVAGDGMLLAELPDEALLAFVGAAGADADFPLVSVELRHLEGALRRRPAGHGALGALDAAYAMFAVTVTPGPELHAAAEHHIAALRATMAPWAAQRSYLNFAETPCGADAFFGDSDIARLRAVKARVDPDGLIRGRYELSR